MTDLATRPPGRRPLLLKSGIRETVLDAIRDGAAIEHAAQAAGITGTTVFNWLRWGREELERRSDETYPHDPSLDCYVEFFAEVEKARADAMLHMVRVVKAATIGGQLLERRTVTRRGGDEEVIEKYQASQWTAAAWMLERHAPALFGKREAHHLTSDPLPDRPVSEEERLAERVRAWAEGNRVIEGEIAAQPE